MDVSPIGQGGGFSAGPQLVADPFGNVTAVWVWSSTTGEAVVQAARFSEATRAWGAAVSLSAVTPAERIRLGRLATDASGNATVAWWRGEGDYPDSSSPTASGPGPGNCTSTATSTAALHTDPAGG